MLKKANTSKRNIKRIILDLIVGFIVALIVDTGNLVLDILIIALALICLECLVLLIMKNKKQKTYLINLN